MLVFHKIHQIHQQPPQGLIIPQLPLPIFCLSFPLNSSRHSETGLPFQKILARDPKCVNVVFYLTPFQRITIIISENKKDLQSLSFRILHLQCAKRTRCNSSCVKLHKIALGKLVFQKQFMCNIPLPRFVAGAFGVAE